MEGQLPCLKLPIMALHMMLRPAEQHVELVESRR